MENPIQYKAICINNIGCESLLNVGQKYLLHESYGEKVFVNGWSDMWFHKDRFKKIEEEALFGATKKQPLVLVSSVPQASIGSLLFALRERYPQQNFDTVLSDITIENASHTLIKKAENFVAGFLAAIP